MELGQYIILVLGAETMDVRCSLPLPHQLCLTYHNRLGLNDLLIPWLKGKQNTPASIPAS